MGFRGVGVGQDSVNDFYVRLGVFVSGFVFFFFKQKTAYEV